MNNIILLFRGLRVSYLQNSIQSYFDLVLACKQTQYKTNRRSNAFIQLFSATK